MIQRGCSSVSTQSLPGTIKIHQHYSDQSAMTSVGIVTFAMYCGGPATVIASSRDRKAVKGAPGLRGRVQGMGNCPFEVQKGPGLTHCCFYWSLGVEMTE